MSDTKPCIYNLHAYCIVEKHLRESNTNSVEWGSVDWIKLHCGMCVKTTYAKAKLSLVRKFSVVNTL